MIEELSIEDTANYSVEQLFDSSDNLKLIEDFDVGEKGRG